MSPSLHSCPTELVEYICSLACQDSGSSARSLALVSSFFNQVSRPFLFQSLSLAGPNQIHAAATNILNTPQHLRRIKHLFLSDEAHRRTDHQLGKSVCDAEAASIIHILTLAAPTLESLAIVITCPSTGSSLLARLFRIPFPFLRELTVHGYYPFPSTSSNFPRLERLHLSGNRNPHGLFQLAALSAACPNVTHLRISGLSMAVSFSLELVEAVKGDEAITSATMFPAKLPPTIQNILIQPGPPPPTVNKPTTAHLKDHQMVKFLSDADDVVKSHLCSVQDGDSSNLSFYLLSRPDTFICPRDIKRDWEERLDGRNGCWTTC